MSIGTSSLYSSDFREVQSEPCIDAEDDDKKGLDGMDDEDEIEGLFISHAIEDEHGLDGKMPGAGTVGRGHDDGYGADDEGDESAT